MIENLLKGLPEHRHPALQVEPELVRQIARKLEFLQFGALQMLAHGLGVGRGAQLDRVGA